MREYLVLRLYAPLSSWGAAAVGEERPTSPVPSRSALLGLLGAALGLRRTDDGALKKLQASVFFGIKQLAAGSLLRDYHTTQVPPQRSKVVHFTRKAELDAGDPETILSRRDYRCDGVWVVAIWLSENSHYTLAQLKSALVKPVFALYMGRKSCPMALPMSPALCEAENLKQALDYQFPPVMETAKEDNWWLRVDGRTSYYWEGGASMLGVDASGVACSETRDDPWSRARWQFKPRSMYQITLQEE